MIKIKKFHLSHLKGFVLHGEDARESAELFPDMSIQESFVANLGYSEKVYSVYYNNKLAGFFGWCLADDQPEGSCNVWFLRDVRCKTLPKIAFLRHAKQLLDLVPKKYKIVGVFKPLAPHYDAQMKWLAALGFTFLKETFKNPDGKELVYFYKHLK